MSDISGMIENAMKDPRFADILSSLKEKADKGELDVSSLINEATAQTSPEKEATSKPGMDSHKKLLAALRPYLRTDRQGAVDGILRIGEFSGIIEALSKKDGR